MRMETEDSSLPNQETPTLELTQSGSDGQSGAATPSMDVDVASPQADTIDGATASGSGTANGSGTAGSSQMETDAAKDGEEGGADGEKGLISNSDLFAAVAQERMLGLIGSLMPPNRQVSSFDRYLFYCVSFCNQDI